MVGKGTKMMIFCKTQNSTNFVKQHSDRKSRYLFRKMQKIDKTSGHYCHGKYINHTSHK